MEDIEENLNEKKNKFEKLNSSIKQLYLRE